MSIFTQYGEKLHLKKASKVLGKIDKSNTSSDFEKLEAVGVLLEVTDADIREKAFDFVKTLEEKVESLQLLGYSNTKKLTENFNFDCFYKKDLNWIWQPKNIAVVENFKKRKLDLLINLCYSKCLPLSYVAVSTSANYKIAALTDYPNDYDLLLDAKNFENYLKQIQFFSSKIHQSV